jgi:hypothetical protein
VLSSVNLGDGDDYLNLALKDGGLALSVNLGNGRLDTGIQPPSVRFDDDNWHHVVVRRVAQEVRKSNASRTSATGNDRTSSVARRPILDPNFLPKKWSKSPNLT